MQELRALAKDELEELFRRSPAGELPDGEAEGVFLVPAVVPRLVWRGKRFDRARGEVVNKVTPFGLEAVRARLSKEPSRLDGKEAIVLDYSQTSFVARKIRDELREVSPGVYLGVVFWGRAKVGLFALELSG